MVRVFDWRKGHEQDKKKQKLRHHMVKDHGLSSMFLQTFPNTV